MFHRELVLIDTNLVNHLGLHRLKERYPNLLECMLHTPELGVALRTGTTSIKTLMESAADKKAYSHLVFGGTDAYLAGYEFIQGFEGKIASRFELSLFGDNFTKMFMECLTTEKVRSDMSRGGSGHHYEHLMDTFRNFSESHGGKLTQVDLTGEESTLRPILKAISLGPYYERHYKSLIEPLARYNYARSGSVSLDAKTVMSKSIFDTGELFTNVDKFDIDQLRIHSDVFYENNLLLLDIETLTAIRIDGTRYFDLMEKGIANREEYDDLKVALLDYLEAIRSHFFNANWSHKVVRAPETFLRIMGVLSVMSQQLSDAWQANPLGVEFGKIAIKMTGIPTILETAAPVLAPGLEALAKAVSDKPGTANTVAQQAIGSLVHLRENIMVGKAGKPVEGRLRANGDTTIGNG